MAIKYTSSPIADSDKVEIYADGKPISQGGPGFDPTYAAQLTGEPAVLSTPSGKTKFQNNVQPGIDRANEITAASADQKKKAESAKTFRLAPDGTYVPILPGEDIPQDVQEEMDNYKSDEEKAMEARLKRYDDRADEITNTYKNLTLSATKYASAQINSLTSQWSERRSLLQESNRRNVATWTQQFVRSGQAEYAPGMTADAIGAKEEEGARKLRDLDDQYNAAVAQVNAALEQGGFERAADLARTLANIEEQSQNLIDENVREAKAVNDQLRAKKIQTDREGAIGSLISQGVTDPNQMLQLLNYYEDGKPTGADFAADEVSKVMKALTVNGTDATDASIDVRTFQYLRDSGMLPSEIVNLPPEEQYFGYLRALKSANTAPARDSGGGSEEDDTAPTYEEYRAAALEATGLGMNHITSPEWEAQLLEQYNAEYGGGEPFTPTEKKKLEQAGLSNATRQEQLNYLYGKKDKDADGEGSEDGMTDEEFLKSLGA